MKKEWMNSAVTEEALELVLAFDQAGRILYGNKAAREKLNYSEEELSACNMTSIFRQEFQQEPGAELPFDREKLLGKAETVMYRKNSSCLPVHLRFFPTEEGYDFLLAEDISPRKSMDVRIRQLKEEEEKNRRTRNEFTANVTHELRTPVNGIKGHVLNLLDVVKDEKQRETLEIILFCCDNMYSIINNILDFSKLEAGKFTLDEIEFDFYKMMDRVIATHMAEISKKELHFSLYIDRNIPQFVIGDALRVSQILNNLLSNAVKFTLLGQISVDVSKTLQVNDEIELFFIVRDTGIGISREAQDKLFESFKQVDASISRRFGGTGLGLSITRQLVEMMNGSIHLESEPGKGSSFSFSIRLHTSKNTEENGDLSKIYEKWADFSGGIVQETQSSIFEFGSRENMAELKKRMEKLVLCLELGSWEKAETLSEAIKALLDGAGSDVKRAFLRLEMAVRKENYERSMAAYEQVQAMLAEK